MIINKELEWAWGKVFSLILGTVVAFVCGL